mgnify:CR=1 FL=1
MKSAAKDSHARAVVIANDLELPNFSALLVRLEAATVAPEPGGALVVLAIEGLETLRALHGFRFGERVLGALVGRLASAVDDEGSAWARVAMDEVALFVPTARTSADVMVVSTRLMGRMARPIDIDRTMVTLSAQVGAFVIDGNAASADQVIARARAAAFRARQQSRSGVQIFDETLKKSLDERLALQVDLPYALERDELRFVFQPIVDLQTAKLAGFESLMRWRHPSRGPVPPGLFIPIAEDGPHRQPGLVVAVRVMPFVAAMAARTSGTESRVRQCQHFRPATHQQSCGRHRA